MNIVRLLKVWRRFRWAIWLRTPRRITFQVFCRRIAGTNRERWNDVIRRDPCSYCGSWLNPTIEHVEPGWRTKKHGGRQRGPAEGKVCACHACNNQRGNMPLLLFLWLRRQPRRREDGGPTVQVQRTIRRRWPQATPLVSDPTFRVRPLTNCQVPAPLRVSIGERIKWQTSSRTT